MLKLNMPISNAIFTGDSIFTADLITVVYYNEIYKDNNIAEKAIQTLNNLKQVLKVTGAELIDVVK